MKMSKGKARQRRYYMLDKKDITNVKGVITAGEVMDELDITNRKFESFVYRNKEFHGCYLVEFDEDNDGPQKFSEYKFYENNTLRSPSRWYVTRDGRFYRYYVRSGIRHELSPFLHHGIWTVRIGGFDAFQAAMVYARYYLDLRDDQYALLNSKKWDIKKIKIVNRQEYILKNNQEKLGKAIGLFEDGHLVKQWPSSREAANDLYISYQTVSDICRNRIKKKLYDLRYI